MFLLCACFPGCKEHPDPPSHVEVFEGKLGDARIRLPLTFAKLVDVNGDPRFGEIRSGHPSASAQAEPVIRGFGFDFRFPDMATLSTDALRQDKQSPSSGERWMYGGVRSGEDFHEKGVHRIAQGVLNDPAYAVSPDARYVRDPVDVHGLEAYHLSGVDASGTPWRVHLQAEDIFLHRNADGEFDVFISCSNRNVPSAPCEHWYPMPPRYRANVHLLYRRQLLKHWKQAQDSLSTLIQSFEVR